jgi:hypothetical protein
VELHREGREYYKLKITTIPALAAGAWEASFDAGTTWPVASVISDVTGDYSAWLVAGEDAEPGTAVAVISHDTYPIVRAVDTPEIVARNAPAIRYKR